MMNKPATKPSKTAPFMTDQERLILSPSGAAFWTPVHTQLFEKRIQRIVPQIDVFSLQARETFQVVKMSDIVENMHLPPIASSKGVLVPFYRRQICRLGYLG